VNASQSRCRLFLARLCSRMGLGTDPRTLGDAEVRSRDGPARRSCHHADRDVHLGDETLQHPPDSRLDNHDGPSGAGDIASCRGRGRLMGARAIESVEILPMSRRSQYSNWTGRTSSARNPSAMRANRFRRIWISFCAMPMGRSSALTVENQAGFFGRTDVSWTV
jgi:hypothetical protein